MNQTSLHGGDNHIYDPQTLDFSANISPLGLPESVKRVLIDSVDTFSRYPDSTCAALCDAIADSERVAREWVHCGSGAADLIFRLVQAVKPARALVLAPTFSEYERALTAAGCEVSFFALHEKDSFVPTDKLLARLTPALDMLFLCNPNNPTGQVILPELMQRVLKKCAANGILVVMDECFVPFLTDVQAHSVKQYLKQYPNLVVLQAFTKLYAMAGLRLGYILCCDDKLLARVSECEPAWNVSVPAQLAGIAALADTTYPAQVRTLIAQERGILAEGIRALGCVVFTVQANYIFFKCNSRRDLKEKLLEMQILIRSCADYRGLDERFYRVAIRTHTENEKLLSAMKIVLRAEDTADG